MIIIELLSNVVDITLVIIILNKYYVYSSLLLLSLFSKSILIQSKIKKKIWQKTVACQIIFSVILSNFANSRNLLTKLVFHR